MKQYPTITIQGNILSAELLGRLEQDVPHQSPKSFGFDRRVKDEIATAWGETKHQWQVFQSKLQRLDEEATATTETRQFWILPFLDTLGYTLEYQPKAARVQGETYDLSHRDEDIGGFPVHVMGYADSLERRRDTSGPRLSPHALVQEYLNLTPHLYALVTNGRQMRLLRDSSRLTRLTYLEFDLVRMMEDEVYADFAVLYRLLHRSRMPQRPETADESVIEGYHQHALEQGARIRDELSGAVKQGIREMANTLLQTRANADLRERMTDGHLSALDLYNQLLRFVYRLLFLFVIEERGLVFPKDDDGTADEGADDNGEMKAREIYDQFYAVSRLRMLAEQSRLADGQKHDLWLRILNTFRLFERSDTGAGLGIAPLAGELFAPDALGSLADAVLDNSTLLRTLSRLTRFKNEQGVWTRVNYAALNVEEFGSVYEGLLEFEPVVTEGADYGSGWTFQFRKGKERDDTGSHYTPEELVRPLVEHALDPVMQKKQDAAEDTPAAQERVLLSLTVCDVACGSGHFLLAAARRIAFELAVVRTGEDQPSPEALRTAKRDVISQCIYGVDKNPMAVELCKVALWLEAHDPGKPLTFLDHRIKCGDAIVGIDRVDSFRDGIPTDPFYSSKVDGEDNDVIGTLRNRNKKERKQRSESGLQLELGDEVSEELESLAERFRALETMPDDTVGQRQEKKKAFDRFQTDEWTRLKTLADAQVAPFFIRKTEENRDRVMTDGTFRRLLHRSGSLPDRPDVEATRKVGQAKKFFHWFLEFPEVFAEGGFDVILGNPPFLGGQKLSGTFGYTYLNWLRWAYKPAGAIDLVAYFFRRNFRLVNHEGAFGCIATQSIAEGRIREGGLAVIIEKGGEINYAVPSKQWPGRASLDVALIAIQKGKWKGEHLLDSGEVDKINSYLSDEEPLPDPLPLEVNEGRSFQGSIVLGMGFVLKPKKAQELIEKDERNEEVLFPYLTGADITGISDQAPSRWVINFFDWTKSKAREYPDCFEIVEEEVKPDRSSSNRKRRREIWWQYAEPAKALYETIETRDRVLVAPIVTKYLSFVFEPTEIG